MVTRTPLEVASFEDSAESGQTTQVIPLSTTGADGKPHRIVFRDEKGTKLFTIDSVDGRVEITGAMTLSGALVGNLAVTGGATFTSTTDALIVPRMTEVQRDALTGAAGMVILNTTTGKLNHYNGSGWKVVTDS